ncbi:MULTISPECIES: hypothetical protein [Desulfitobacterium]
MEEELIMQTYYLYIVLTRTNTVLSKLIHMFKQDEYTHAALSLDSDLNHMYSFGRRNPYNPFIGRFRREDIHEGVYGFCENLPGAIIEVEVTQQQYDKVKELLNHFIVHSDRYRYNYRGLFYSLLDKPLSNENRFLCSEFVYFVLKESGITDLKMPRNLVRPQNLLHAEGRIIYQGDLKAVKPQTAIDLYAQEIRRRRLKINAL